MENIPVIEDILGPGTSVHIEYIDHNGKKIIHEAVVSNLDKAYLRLEMPHDALRHMTEVRSRQTKIPIICKCDNQPRDYVFFTEFVKLDHTSPTMVVTRPASFVLGRNFLRYEVDLPFSYFLDGKEFNDCRMANLSFGGLLGIIKPNSILEPGMEMVCQVTFPPDSSPEYIVGQITRIEPQATNTKISVQFEDLTKDIETKIAKYFFSIEKNTINGSPRK
jgi:c-di-GMP-binding flagellar brake protein YcgR